MNAKTSDSPELFLAVQLNGESDPYEGGAMCSVPKDDPGGDD